VSAAQTVESNEDVTGFLIRQHGEIRDLFAQVGAASGDERAELFYRLRRLLALHETAEELVVHPRARWDLSGGDPVVNPRLKEETLAKDMLVELEKMPTDSAQFEAGFAKFRETVLAHAEAEEREEFPRMREEIEPSHLEMMRTAVKLAEAVGPTRPHPGVTFAGEHLLTGGFATMLDRARDLISKPSAGT
jgi:hemerythrin superfamily protein